MNDETFRALENALRREAESLDPPQTEVGTNLVARYRRRIARRRIVGRTIGVVAATAALIAPFIWERPGVPRTREHELGPNNESVARSMVPSPQAVNPAVAPSQSLAVPLLFVSRHPDGTEVITPAVLMPSHASPVNPKRLTAVERRAIREVLNIREPSESNNAI